MGYAAYFNATRDPAAEAKLLEIRDLIFTRYYTAGSGTAADPERIMDAKNFTLVNEVDTGANGGDITNLLVPGDRHVPARARAAHRPGPPRAVPRRPAHRSPRS